MRLVTANIQNRPDLPREKVRAAAATTAKLGGIACFQEIGEVEDHADIKQAMGAGWNWLFDGAAIPIAVKSRYWIIEEYGYEVMHGPLPGISPERLITWAIIRKRSRFGRGKRIVVMNTHFISGAWNDNDVPQKEERRRLWEQHWAKMQVKVEEFVSRGLSVLILGDFNRIRVKKFSGMQVWLAEHGYDKIGFIPALGGARLVRTWVSGHTPDASDHDALWAHGTVV